MRTFTESAGGHLSGYVNMSGITGKENSGWIPDNVDEDIAMQEYLAVDEIADENPEDEDIDDLALALEGIEILGGNRRKA